MDVNHQHSVPVHTACLPTHRFCFGHRPPHSPPLPPLPRSIRHRGPDWSGAHVTAGHAIGHERLAIMDPDSGAQPLFSEDRSIALAVNGEIYNYEALQAGLSKPFDFKTKSDCEVIIPLYEEHGDGEGLLYTLRTHMPHTHATPRFASCVPIALNTHHARTVHVRCLPHGVGGFHREHT